MANQPEHKKWGECYYDHFEKFLGKPSGREKFEQKPDMPMIQVIHYDNIFDNCRAFCSFGFSRYVAEVGEVAEVFMPIDEGWDTTARILADTLFQIVQRHMRIGWGMTFRFANIFPDFTRKYGKAAIYFSNPFGVPQGFSQVQCEGEVGSVYPACYISEAERQYFLEHGAVNFENLFEEKNVDVFQLTRPSVV